MTAPFGADFLVADAVPANQSLIYLVSASAEIFPWNQPIYQGTRGIAGLSTNSDPAQASDTSGESRPAGKNSLYIDQGITGNPGLLD